MTPRRLEPTPSGFRNPGWRILRRSLSLKRPQSIVTLVSLTMGAAIASLLLNLYGDTREKMTREFRAFGPNLIVSPAGQNKGGIDRGGSAMLLDFRLMDEQELERMRLVMKESKRVALAPVLHAVARVRRASAESSEGDWGDQVVVIGTDFAALHRLYPGLRQEVFPGSSGQRGSMAGEQVVGKLRLQEDDSLELEVRGPSSTARLRYPVNGKVSTGGSEGGQVFIPLADLQAALGIPGKISLAELRIEGSTDQIEEVARQLSANFPLLEVRPVREIVYSEGQVLETVRWALLSLTLVVVIITVLCLLATVTAIVLERRREIGLMKALGAADGQLMAFFLTEVAILASVGGLAGFGVGGVLAKLLGIRLFGVPLDLHWPSLPGVLLATLAVSLLGAWPPIRVVRRIRPAWVLKGE